MGHHGYCPYLLQDFLVLLEQNEAWISTKEASLALHSLGVGPW